MTPELTLLYMRFQVLLGQAALKTKIGDHELAAIFLDDANTLAVEFDKEITPPPADVWVLKFTDAEGGYATRNSLSPFTRTTHGPSMLQWLTIEGAQAYARHANIWKMVEPELLRG